MSGHKFYGPKGIGALYVKKGTAFEPIIHGGHQEKDKRAGTENIPGIVGIGKAIEIATRDVKEYNFKLETLRNRYIEGILSRVPDVKLNGHPSRRLPGNANFSFWGIDGKELLLMLSENGIYVSSGSACNTGHIKTSHVLLALGTPPELARGSLRVTFGEENTISDVDQVVNHIQNFVQRLRSN